MAAFATSVDIPTVPPRDDVDEDDGLMFPSRRLERLAAHHRLTCDAIQATVDGTESVNGRPVNLMLLMPPGSAKSTYADVVAVPWFMARRERGRGGVILASYASDIAKKQGRRARQLIQSKSFMSIFPDATMSPSQSAADEWALTNGNEYMAGGLLSGLTGNRAALGILDDPIRGREAAESETIRNKTWDAYVDDFCSRLIPGAPQIMILTRWHEDDPAGRILPEGWQGESGVFEGRDGRLWRVICLPAICDSQSDPLGRAIGETLWPEWFTLEHWAPFKRNARTWSSLYQQQPSSPEGTFFKGEWFKRYSVGELPTALHVYMTSDHAPGGTENDDFNVFRVWGVDQHQHIWMLDGYRVQGTIDKAMGVKLNELTGEQTLLPQGALPLIKRWKPLCWFPENDNNWKSAKPFIIASMRRNSLACRIEEISTAGGDKATKAQPFQAKAAMGEIHIPLGADGDLVVDQYKRFPGGRWDDEIDAAANMGRALDMAHPAIVSSAPAAKTVDIWGRPRDADGDWRAA